jgi:hypothetical protein
VSEIRNPTPRSYVLLIVDSRNITGRHPGGNARELVSKSRRWTGPHLLAVDSMQRALDKGRTTPLATDVDRAYPRARSGGDD